MASVVERALRDVPAVLVYLLMDYVPELYVESAPEVRRKAMQRVCVPTNPSMSQSAADCLVMALPDLERATRGPPQSFDPTYRWDLSGGCHFVEKMKQFLQLRELMLDCIHPPPRSVKHDQALRRALLVPFYPQFRPGEFVSPLKRYRRMIQVGRNPDYEDEVRIEAKRRLLTMAKYPALYPLIIRWYGTWRPPSQRRCEPGDEDGFDELVEQALMNLPCVLQHNLEFLARSNFAN